MQRILKALVAGALVITIGAGSFLGGVLFERVRGGFPVPTSPTSSATQDLVGEVRGIMLRDALKPASETSMTTGALDGLLGSLEDTYAVYFDPKANKEFQMDAQGEFFGVGMSVGMRETTPTVMSVFKGTPAEKAGLKADDQIVAVDGKRNKKWSVDEVVALIRGPKGTQVTLQVYRPSTGKSLTFKVTRDKITIPNIMGEMVGKDVGLIRLMQFNELAVNDIKTKMSELDRKGAKGYILDLRENPGGLLSSAVGVVSLYVESGVVVRIDERGKPEQQEMALGNKVTDKPLVVLVDANSASASEIVAGALQDYGRAVIVGVTSYGKGSVQVVRELSNGGAVKLTNAHYLTPKSRVINGKGVTPDVVVTMDPALQAKQSTDTQLKKALEVLRSKF